MRLRPNAPGFDSMWMRRCGDAYFGFLERTNSCQSLSVWSA